MENWFWLVLWLGGWDLSRSKELNSKLDPIASKFDLGTLLQKFLTYKTFKRRICPFHKARSRCFIQEVFWSPPKHNLFANFPKILNLSFKTPAKRPLRSSVILIKSSANPKSSKSISEVFLVRDWSSRIQISFGRRCPVQDWNDSVREQQRCHRERCKIQ